MMPNDNDANEDSSGLYFSKIRDVSRRNVFQRVSAVAGGSAVWARFPRLALAGSRPVGSSEHPVAVIGAGGRTGMAVAQTLAKEGLYAVTITRTGKEPPVKDKLPPGSKGYLFHYADPVDVRNKEEFKRALLTTQASAIVYCASASPQGGTAQEVDCDGLAVAAQAARELNALLVDVSVLAVERPKSKAYQVTNALEGNLFGMMDAKLEGEKSVRDILKSKKNYIIIRPGSFMKGTTKNGAIDIELNQGDTSGGGLTVDELGGVIVGALTSGKRGITVEVFRRGTAFPLQSSFDQPTGNERFSDSYEGLFEFVKADARK